MSLVLYNCDSARLPQQIVEGLGDLNDDEDMRCQVMLPHTDGERESVCGMSTGLF